MGNIFDPMPIPKKFEPKESLKRRIAEARNGTKPPEPSDTDKAMIAADLAKQKKP